jgi:hypothetical protein
MDAALSDLVTAIENVVRPTFNQIAAYWGMLHSILRAFAERPSNEYNAKTR